MPRTHRTTLEEHFGNHIVSAGQNVTNSNTTTIAARYGSNGKATSPIFALPTLQATNNETPTGGVLWPIPSARIIITPKWTGSMPIFRAIGIKIGTSKIMAGVRSMKVPMANRIPSIISLITIVLSVEPTIAAADTLWQIFDRHQPGERRRGADHQHDDRRELYRIRQALPQIVPRQAAIDNAADQQRPDHRHDRRLGRRHDPYMMPPTTNTTVNSGRMARHRALTKTPPALRFGRGSVR